jgi:hypothetical protein
MYVFFVTTTGVNIYISLICNSAYIIRSSLRMMTETYISAIKTDTVYLYCAFLDKYSEILNFPMQ